MQESRLIIAEKPSVALRLAMSLGDGRPKTNYVNGVRYYELQHENATIYIVAAAGHLFTIRQVGRSEIPVFDVEWVESYKENEGAYYTKKYLDVIGIVGKRCSVFINACDYDVEGTVIGTNIIKYVINGNVNKDLEGSNVKRMRFSTTTNADLINSYSNLDAVDISNFYAGEARHKLDWLWGINLSRALMRALSTTGLRKILSIGRVQGPALAILAKREQEIRSFVPKRYWKVSLVARGVRFENRKEKIFEQKSADDVYKTTSEGKAIVTSQESKEKSSRPFPPFDLTSMQIEASRVFGIDPSRALAVAQALYERSYISYPRTSSQKLPASLNMARILDQLSKNPKYLPITKSLTERKRFRPAEGAKEDEAHPAIYPTGELASKLSAEEEKIYDLITRRFLACLEDYASIESNAVVITVGNQEYTATGDRIKNEGWMATYQYYKPRTMEMPKFEKGEEVKKDKVELKDAMTEPPRRYNKASLISTLEDKELGTKATRAEIIDTLFRRDYIKGVAIETTELGMAIFTALNLYCNQIVDEQMTRKLEVNMESITKGGSTEAQVIGEGKEMIKTIIESFKKNEREIGLELQKGIKDAEASGRIGVCKEGGNLVLRKSRTGKSFIGCSNWPKCTITYSVPQYAKIVPTGKVCEVCKTPKIKVFRKGKRPFEMCLESTCPTKADWGKKEEEAEAPKAVKATEIKGAVETKPVEAAAVVAAKTKPKKSSTKTATRAKPKRAKKAAPEEVQ